MPRPRLLSDDKIQWLNEQMREQSNRNGRILPNRVSEWALALEINPLTLRGYIRKAKRQSVPVEETDDGKSAICSICGVTHTRYRDASMAKFASYCHSCHAARRRSTATKYADLPGLAKVKANARSMANTYKRRGKLVPQPCADCGAGYAQMHHPDYTEPLKVEWLCEICHRNHHQTEKLLEKLDAQAEGCDQAAETP